MENSINITPTPSGKPATADLYKYSVGNAIQGVDPLPVPRTSEEAKKKALADIDKAFLNASRPDAYRFDKPTTFNAGQKGFNYDRYYSHPKFKQLGFSPLRDNESFYNQHSSTWDDLGRAVKQMPKMLGLGVTSTFGNWSNMLSMKPDTESAEEMEKAMSIASSSRDTIGAKTVNFLSNVPYTLGVISEIYAEEAALMLASRIPGMQGLAAMRTEQNLLKGGLAFDRLFDTFRAANNVQNAKQAYDASKTLGNFAKSWLPFQNTAELFRDSGRAAANIDKLSDLAAGYKTFGAFYRDLREINLVTAEAKLEGGFVQNEVANNLIDEFKKKNGRDPNDQEAQSIYQQARTAGYTAGFLNTGGIYLSNKVVLERALKGLPFMDEVEHLAGKGIKNGKLIQNADWKTSGKNPWEVISGFGSGVKALGNKYYRQQILKNAPKNSMRFLSANMMEGVQEMYQEGTAKGVTDYYTQTYLNPSKVGKAQILSSLKTGVKSQMSGEGLEVFLSGFLMAGPIQAVQSSVHGAYNFGQLAQLKIKDKAFKADPTNAGKVSPYEKYLKDQKAYNDKVVNALNTLTKDTKSYFSNVDANVKAQKDFADLFEAAVVEGDVKGAVDAKDDSFAQHIMTLMESGHLDLFVDHLNGLKQLDEKELAASLYENPGNNTYDKKTTLERIDAVVGRINQVKDTYNKYQGLTNPFDFRQDPIGYFAFESARKIAVFNDFSYQRTGERMTSILQKLKTNTSLAGVDYADIATMFSINPKLLAGAAGGIGGTNNMLAILKQEIDNMNAGTDEQKAEAVKLQDKYDKLKSLSTLIQDYASNLDTLQTATEENAEELATSTEESEKLLRTAFGDYIKLLAKNNGTTILDKDIDKAFDDFRDYWRLNRDKTQFAEAVNALNNPEYFSNVARRINGALEVASQVSAKRAKEEVDEYRRRHATDAFLNGLLSQFNAYISEDEAEAYLANNIIPQKFIDADSGQLIPSNDSRYQKILEFIDATDDSYFELTGKRLFKPVVEDAGEKLYKEGTDLFYAEELDAYATQTVAAKEDSDKRNFVDMAKQFGFDRSAPMSEVTIGSVLTAIINGPGTVQQKELARLLKGLLDGNEKITFVRNHYTNSTYDQRNGVMVDARYSSEDYKVLGMDKVSIEYSILSALMQKVVIENSSDKEFTDKIKDIRESLLKELSDQQKASYAYAFTNNTSFLSEMLTNPFFASLAAQYEYTGEQVDMTKEAQTMFGAFFKTLTDFLKKLLNITNEERSVYKQALNVLANKLSETPKSTEEEKQPASTAEEFSKLDPKLQEELKAAFESKKTKVAETDPEIAKGMTLDQWYLNDLEARRIISNFKTKKKAKEKEGEGTAGTVITMDNIPQLATALGYTIQEINAMILDGTPTQELLDIINNKVVSPKASVLNEEGMEAISDALREARQKLAAKKLSLTDDDKNYVDEDGTLFERVTTIVKDPFEADSKTASFRGTIIDDLTRDFLAGRIQTINEFKDAYTASRNKISSKPGFTDKDASELPIFTANFLNELFDNLRTVKRALDRNGIKIISDIPTLYGKLDGKDAAGSIDLLGYNNKGEIFIIDLKTSTLERNEQYALEEAFEEAMGEDYAEFKSILKNNENSLLIRDKLNTDMQNKMTLAFAKFGIKYPELKESAQKGYLYLYKESDQAQLAAYRELLRQSTGIVADKLYIFPILTLKEGLSSIKYNRSLMVPGRTEKGKSRTGYVMDITTPDSTYRISSLRQTVFEYPANPIVKPGATKTPTSDKEGSERTEAEEKLKQIWNRIGNNLGRNALEEGWAESFGYLAETLSVGGQNYQAHGMGKSGFAYALRDLFELLNKGIDPNRGGGQLYTAPLAIEEKNKAAASAIGTAGGTAYTDGAFVIVAKKGIVGIKSINDIGGILVNSGLTDINPEILTELRKAFPDLVIESYKNAKGLVEQLNQKKQAPETPDSNTPLPYLTPAIIVKEYNAEGDNKLLEGEDYENQLQRIEKTIASGIKNGLSREQIMQMLNANRHVFNIGNDSITVNNFIQNRIDGTETRTFSQFAKNTKEVLETPVSDIEGQVGTSNYSVDNGLIFYNNPDGTVTPVANPEGKPVMDVIIDDIERRKQEDLDKLKENLENDLKEAEKEPDSAPKIKIRKADGSIDSNSIRQNAIEAANSSYEYGVRRINTKYDTELAALEGKQPEESTETKDLKKVSSSKLNNNLGTIQKLGNSTVYSQNKNRGAGLENYTEDAYYVSDDIVILSDGMSDSAEGGLSHQLVQEIAKRKNEIKDKQSLANLLNSIEINNPDYSKGPQQFTIGTLIVYVPALNKIFSIGDSSIEVNGKRIEKDNKYNVGFNNNKTLLPKNKSVDEVIDEIDVNSGDSISLYTDEIPKIFKQYTAPFEQMATVTEELKKNNKLKDDVTIIQIGTQKSQTEPTPRESAIQAAEELIKTAPSKAKNIRKDIEMMRVSDGFIGSKVFMTDDNYKSATEAYQRGWGTAANPSDFTGMNAVMISGSGTWNPRKGGGKLTNDDIVNKFNTSYVRLIDKAIAQGVTKFNVGTAAGMDKVVSDYLESRGFEKTSKGQWNEFTKKEDVDKNSYEYLRRQAGSMAIGETKGVSLALWDREKLMWRFFNKKTKEEYSFKKSKQFAKNMFRGSTGWFRVWWNQTLNDSERKEIFDLYFRTNDVIKGYEDNTGEAPSHLQLVLMKNLKGKKFKKSKELTWATDALDKVWFSDKGDTWDNFIINLKAIDGSEDVTDSGIFYTIEDSGLLSEITDIIKNNPKGITQKAIDKLEQELTPEGLIETAKDEFFDKTGVDFEDFMTVYESLGQNQDIYYIDPETYEVTDPVDKIQFAKREPRPKPAERVSNVAPQFKGKVIYITTDSSIQEDFGGLGDGVKKGNDFIVDILNEPRIVNRLMEIAKDAKKSATTENENDLAEGLIRALSANIIDLKGVLYSLNPLAASNLGANNARTYLYQQALKNAKEAAATGTTVVFDNTGALPFYNMFDVIIVNPLSDIKRDAGTDNIDKAEKAVPADKRLTISAIYGVDILKGTAQQTGLGDIRARIGAVTNKSQLTLIRAELDNAMTLGTLDKELALAGTTYEEVQSLIATKKQEVTNQLEIKDIVIRMKEPVIYEFNDNGTKLILIPYNKGTTFVSFHDVTDKFENLDTVANLDLRANTKFRTLAEEDINQNLRPMTIEEKAPKPKTETVKKSNDAQSDLTNDAAARIQKMKAKRTAMDNTSTDDSLNDLFNKCSS